MKQEALLNECIKCCAKSDVGNSHHGAIIYDPAIDKIIAKGWNRYPPRNGVCLSAYEYHRGHPDSFDGFEETNYDDNGKRIKRNYDGRKLTYSSRLSCPEKLCEKGGPQGISA